MQQGKLSFGVKAMYGIGSISDVIMANIVFQLWGPIYIDGLGVSPALIGLAVSIPRIWDAVTDPFMGNISDNTRLKWGRRRPYLFLGALLGGILCTLLWMPPMFLSSNGHFVYFLVLSILFFTAYTIFSVPYNALGYELTSDYDERTSVMSYKTFMMNLGSVLLLPWAYKLCLLPQFGNSAVEGVRVVGAIFGVIIFAAGLFAALFCKEYPDAKTQAKINFIDALKYTFSNKVFLMLAVIILCVLSGVFLAFPLLYFINMAYIAPGNEDKVGFLMGLYGTVYGVVGLLAVPLINYLGRRFDKKKTLLGGLLLLMSSFPASWLLFTPEFPKLQIVFAMMASPGLSFIFILSSSMVADICDLDELKTGLRREGVYGAVFTFLVKLGLGGVMALSGVILGLAGYDQEIRIQTAETVFRLRLMFMGLPFVTLIIAFVLTCLYPVTKERMIEVRAQIQQRSQDGKD